MCCVEMNEYTHVLDMPSHRESKCIRLALVLLSVHMSKPCLWTNHAHKDIKSQMFGATISQVPERQIMTNTQESERDVFIVQEEEKKICSHDVKTEDNRSAMLLQ